MTNMEFLIDQQLQVAGFLVSDDQLTAPLRNDLLFNFTPAYF